MVCFRQPASFGRPKPNDRRQSKRAVDQISGNSRSRPKVHAPIGRIHAAHRLPATLVASNAICEGKLKVLLADFQLSSFWLSAVYPRTQRGAFKLKLFIETLAASFALGGPPWDRASIEPGCIPSELIEG